MTTPPDDGSDDGDRSPPDTDRERVWAAYGVSAAALLHLVTTAVLLLSRSR
ncbi:hypothetical protein ACFVUH_01830 [Kitasatospora sp. NPDC058032]|uniref:hypothetical protein n=1 Tax=unclassified Kitasatospora TaxID=2633591 RepID=UPI0036D78E59